RLRTPMDALYPTAARTRRRIVPHPTPKAIGFQRGKIVAKMGACEPIVNSPLLSIVGPRFALARHTDRAGDLDSCDHFFKFSG
ncbi:MAG: hypothetical protein WBF47_17615, partial [Xanthobacteraceae bacterium]